MSTLTFPEQNLHALRHVNAEEHVEITNHRRDSSQECSFCNGVLREIALPECLGAEVPFDNKLAVNTAKNANDDKENDLEEMPIPIVRDLEHDELSSSEGIHELALPLEEPNPRA